MEHYNLTEMLLVAVVLVAMFGYHMASRNKKFRKEMRDHIIEKAIKQDESQIPVKRLVVMAVVATVFAVMPYLGFAIAIMFRYIAAVMDDILKD